MTPSSGWKLRRPGLPGLYPISAPSWCPYFGCTVESQSKMIGSGRARHIGWTLRAVNARQDWTHFRPSRIDPPPGELLAGWFDFAG